MHLPSPATFNTVLDRIRAFAEARGWKPARLAREARLSDVTTRSMARPDWAPSGNTVRALEALIPADWKPGDPLPAPSVPNGVRESSAAVSAAPGEGP
jgi:hypothetical protein